MQALVGDAESCETALQTDRSKRNSSAAVVSSDPPSGRKLSNDIGYPNLPSVGTGSDLWATYASQIRDLMADIDSGAAVCGWIIDLRRHTLSLIHI